MLLINHYPKSLQEQIGLLLNWSLWYASKNEGRQFRVMSDGWQGMAKATEIDTRVDFADKGDLTLIRAKSHNGGCCCICHTLHYHLPVSKRYHELFQLILSYFLSITCKKYDVPHTLSIAFSQPDGSAVWIQWYSQTVPARINKLAYLFKSSLEATKIHEFTFSLKSDSSWKTMSTSNIIYTK